jgi:hypothetical protein
MELTESVMAVFLFEVQLTLTNSTAKISLNTSHLQKPFNRP